MTLDVRYGHGRACITSVVTDPSMTVYMAGLERMKRRLVEVGYEGSWRLWAGCYPPGSPSHADAGYGFKVHAIEEARRAGYSQIVWLDAEAFPVKDLGNLFMRLALHGVISVSGHEPLGEWCSDEALGLLARYSRIDREIAHGQRDDDWGTPRVQAGKVYAVDYLVPDGVAFMDQWRVLLDRGVFSGPAINTGAGPEVEASARRSLGHRSAGFCSADPRVRGHRHDEIAAGFIVWQKGLPTGTVADYVYGGSWSLDAIAKPAVYFCGAPGDEDPR